MVHTDPVRHPFTAGYEPFGGDAADALAGAPPLAMPAGADETDPAETPPTTHRPEPSRRDDDFADRLRVDPDRGDTKG